MFSFDMVPHTFIEPEKSHKVRYAQEMIRALDNHLRTGFKYLLTGDESWMTFADVMTLWTGFKRP
jgi:hypothetical protein